jgi:hypothetical protein
MQPDQAVDGPNSTLRDLALFVRLMIAARRAVLLDFELLRHRALVLGSHVVVAVAGTASKHQFIAHDDRSSFGKGWGL